MSTRQLTYNSFWICSTVTLLYGIISVEHWGIFCITILILSLIGVRQDSSEISWFIFLPVGCSILCLFYLIYGHAGSFWEQFVSWQTKSIHHWLSWNELFNKIPWNDGVFFHRWQPNWLTSMMKVVYGYGFTLSYWVCVIRAFFTKDIKKIGVYSLAGYLLQVPLILPFYNIILLQEVWYVKGMPDLLQRDWNSIQQAQNSINCFPSMHTSIAFAAIILVQREQSMFYRGMMTIFGMLIIFSTLYLRIHWVLDVAAGMIFAFFCVKLADLIVQSYLFNKMVFTWERLGLTLYKFMATGGEKNFRKP